MNLPPLVLSVRRDGSPSSPRPTNKQEHSELLELHKRAFARDKYACVYCGFSSPQHQRLLYIDGDLSHRTVDNVATVCPLCHQVLHIDEAGRNDGGSIILCPELTQVELNLLIYGMWVWSEEGGEYAEYAEQAYVHLEDRSFEADARYGRAIRDPSMLAEILRDMPAKQYDSRGIFLKDLRLLPARDRFAKHLAYWKENVFPRWPRESWGALQAKFLPN